MRSYRDSHGSLSTSSCLKGGFFTASVAICGQTKVESSWHMNSGVDAYVSRRMRLQPRGSDQRAVLVSIIVIIVRCAGYGCVCVAGG